MSDLAGKEVTTIEGLSTHGEHAVQKAWQQVQVPQCGYCQSGQIMQAAALLKQKAKPSDKRDRGGYVGQHLPLRHLSAYPSGHQDSVRPGEGGDRMSDRVQLASRRDFLAGIFSAGAFILGARVVSADQITQASDVKNATWNPNIWIGVNSDGSVVIVTHRSEMGTGIRTSLPMVLADELEADWTRVRLQQAIGSDKYGSQDTDGSCSIRDFYQTMREAGATARAMLVNAAAAQLKAPLDECFAHNHEVVHKNSGRKLGYGELAAVASKQPMPYNSTIQLKKPSEFRYIGKGVPGYDVKDMTTGQAIYGFDARVPDMVYASIERSPCWAAR